MQDLFPKLFLCGGACSIGLFRVFLKECTGAICAAAYSLCWLISAKKKKIKKSPALQSQVAGMFLYLTEFIDHQQPTAPPVKWWRNLSLSVWKASIFSWGKVVKGFPMTTEKLFLMKWLSKKTVLIIFSGKMVPCILNFGWDTQNALKKAGTLQMLSLSELVPFIPFAFKILQCENTSPFGNFSKNGWNTLLTQVMLSGSKLYKC